MRAYARLVLARVLTLLLAAAGLSGCGRHDEAAPARASDAARRALSTYGGRPAAEFVFASALFPPADRPVAVAASAADHVAATTEVFGVEVDGEARAYPIRVISLHHVVNDEVGGRPVAVTYCMTCSSGIAYDPVVDGRRLTFGTDGAWRGVATLFDRETGSVWLHLTGHCIEGPLRGKRLAPLPTGLHVPWAVWRALHSDTTVMRGYADIAERAGGMRYADDANATAGRPGWPPEMVPTLAPPDARLHDHTLLHGLVVDGHARAYPHTTLARHPIVEDMLGGRPITVWYDANAHAAAAYVPRTRGRFLTFRRDAEGRIRDEETNGTWDLEGRCVAGPLAGARLPRVPGLQAEWYGWSAYHENTTIWVPAVVTSGG